MEILPVTRGDLPKIKILYKEVKQHLRTNGIYQWDRYYPNSFIFCSDIKKGHLYGLKEKEEYIGVIVVDEKQSGKYASLNWHEKTGKPLTIHRLAVHPWQQGRGLGKILLRFAEDYARLNGYTSIRLDVFTGNPGAVGLYRNAGYKEVGEIHFPMRKLPYLCFEKLMKL
jgi:ribosomal protein S18 acetylase RimI-like enzyme